MEVKPRSCLSGFRVMFQYWMKFHQFNLKQNKEASLIILQPNCFVFLILFFFKIRSYNCKLMLKSSFKCKGLWGDFGLQDWICPEMVCVQFSPSRIHINLSVSPTQVCFVLFFSKMWNSSGGTCFEFHIYCFTQTRNSYVVVICCYIVWSVLFLADVYLFILNIRSMIM